MIFEKLYLSPLGPCFSIRQVLQQKTYVPKMLTVAIKVKLFRVQSNGANRMPYQKNVIYSIYLIFFAGTIPASVLCLMGLLDSNNLSFGEFRFHPSLRAWKSAHLQNPGKLHIYSGEIVLSQKCQLYHPVVNIVLFLCVSVFLPT